MKLIIGNKNYSSWSLRGWLACKQSGLAFEEIIVPLYGDDWEAQKKQQDDLAPSSGKVPILWDGDAVVWDSLAIIEFLADKVGRDRFWPKEDDARAMARSMVAEMHSSYLPLRHQCPMNIRRRVEGRARSARTPGPTSCVSSRSGQRRGQGSARAGRSCSAASARRTSSMPPSSAASSPMACRCPASPSPICRRCGNTNGCRTGSKPPRPRNG